MGGRWALRPISTISDAAGVKSGRDFLEASALVEEHRGGSGLGAELF